jgi:hypothetical protein
VPYASCYQPRAGDCLCAHCQQIRQQHLNPKFSSTTDTQPAHAHKQYQNQPKPPMLKRHSSSSQSPPSRSENLVRIRIRKNMVVRLHIKHQQAFASFDRENDPSSPNSCCLRVGVEVEQRMEGGTVAVPDLLVSQTVMSEVVRLETQGIARLGR